MKLLCRFDYATELLTVACHEHRDFTWRLRKMQQRPVHFCLSVREFGKIFQMRRLLFDFLPQLFNRVEIGRVGWQLFNGQAPLVRLEKRLHRFARMITGAILDHDEVLLGLREHIEQKCRITLRIEAPRMRFVEKLPGERVNEAKDFVAFALATGRLPQAAGLWEPTCNSTSPIGQNWPHHQKVTAPFCAVLAVKFEATESDAIRGVWPH